MGRSRTLWCCSRSEGVFLFLSDGHGSVSPTPGRDRGGTTAFCRCPRLYRHRFVRCARSHVRRSASGADGHPNPYRGTGNTRAAEKTKKNHPPRPGGHVARSPSTWRPQGPQNAPLRSRREALSAFSTHCGWSMLRRSRRSGWVSSRHAPWHALLWHDDPGISQRYAGYTHTHVHRTPPKTTLCGPISGPPNLSQTGGA